MHHHHLARKGNLKDLICDIEELAKKINDFASLYDMSLMVEDKIVMAGFSFKIMHFITVEVTLEQKA